MPDITMCVNEDCPQKMNCYRFQAEPKEYHQSVSRFQPIDGVCDAFMTLEGWDPRGIRNSPEPIFKIVPKSDI